MDADVQGVGNLLAEQAPLDEQQDFLLTTGENVEAFLVECQLLHLVVRYTQGDTPLSFRNRIAYTFNEQSSEINYIEHQFWLSSLQNYSEKAAISKQKIEECETKSRKVQRSFTMYSPSKFYNRYIMNPAVKNRYWVKKHTGDDMY